MKLILYGNTLSLPDLSQYNKSAIITNDFFLSDNLGYMSVYHNEILPVLAKLDSKYIEDIGIDGDIYTKVPKFDYPEGHNEYFKPLVPAKPSNKRKKRKYSDSICRQTGCTSILRTMIKWVVLLLECFNSSEELWKSPFL